MPAHLTNFLERDDGGRCRRCNISIFRSEEKTVVTRGAGLLYHPRCAVRLHFGIEGRAGNPLTPEEEAWLATFETAEPMSWSGRMVLRPDCRAIFPAKLRPHLPFAPGDVLSLQIVDGHVQIRKSAKPLPGHCQGCGKKLKKNWPRVFCNRDCQSMVWKRKRGIVDDEMAPGTVIPTRPLKLSARKRWLAKVKRLGYRTVHGRYVECRRCRVTFQAPKADRIEHECPRNLEM